MELVLGPESLDTKVSFLVGAGAGSFSHAGTNLLAHLLGTYEMLRSWGVRDALCDAGLFHSVYGTESYVETVLPMSHRTRVRALIGADAEESAYLFGVMIKRTFYETLAKRGAFSVCCRLTGNRIVLRESQVADLCQLAVANWLEQRPRVAVQYQFMKRAEFGAMRRFLSPPARLALDTIYHFDTV